MKPITLVADVPTIMEETFGAVQTSAVARPSHAATASETSTSTDSIIDLQINDVNRIYNELRQEVAAVEEREALHSAEEVSKAEPMDIDNPDPFDDLLEDILSDDTEGGDGSPEELTPEEMDHLCDLLATPQPRSPPPNYNEVVNQCARDVEELSLEDGEVRQSVSKTILNSTSVDAQNNAKSSNPIRNVQKSLTSPSRRTIYYSTRCQVTDQEQNPTPQSSIPPFKTDYGASKRPAPSRLTSADGSPTKNPASTTI